MNELELKEVVWQALSGIDLTRLEAIFPTVDGWLMTVDGKNFEIKIEIKEIK